MHVLDFFFFFACSSLVLLIRLRSKIRVSCSLFGCWEIVRNRNENFEMLCRGLCREDCNWGVFVPWELEKQELEEVRFMIDVNLMSTFHLIKAKDEESEEPWTGVDHHYIIADRSGIVYLNKCDVFTWKFYNC